MQVKLSWWYFTAIESWNHTQERNQRYFCYSFSPSIYQLSARKICPLLELKRIPKLCLPLNKRRHWNRQKMTSTRQTDSLLHNWTLTKKIVFWQDSNYRLVVKRLQKKRFLKQNAPSSDVCKQFMPFTPF